jgi:hypothetical protein
MITKEPAIGNQDDIEYDEYLKRLQTRFVLRTENRPLFQTNVADLFAAYLATLPEETRQYHNCDACKRFLNEFGTLAVVSNEGVLVSAMWCVEDTPDSYKGVVAVLEREVRRAKITGVFKSTQSIWGKPVTGVWHHFSVTPDARFVHTSKAQTAGQWMAEKREDFKTVMRALREFSSGTLNEVVGLLRSDALYRSEKVLGQAEWLYELSKQRTSSTRIWQAVATAPAGFCHPRSSMIGTLLDDIDAGLDFAEVSRRFREKMHPLRYQRPQAAPSVGAIAAAEKLVEQLGIERSLHRRFATIEEIPTLWRPVIRPTETTNGVFGHLHPKGSTTVHPLNVPSLTMTWEKFCRTVLPTADQLELYTPPARGPFSAFVTAVHQDAPPIIQWDEEGRRNPVSWYFWHGGSTPEDFALISGRWQRVVAVTLLPSMWNGGFEHHGAGVMFVLAGARDQKPTCGGLFPELLKSELRGVRSVIEAYSKSATIQDVEGQHAAGLMMTKRQETWSKHSPLRVTSTGRVSHVILDRWD